MPFNPIVNNYPNELRTTLREGFKNNEHDDEIIKQLTRVTLNHGLIPNIQGLNDIIEYARINEDFLHL